MLADAEAELEIVKKRLEISDPNFKWENQIWNKIIATLKRHNISPKQAFEHFDKNGDGRLNREEFMSALRMMRIEDLT